MELVPATWSAIAATFSALSSFLLVLIHWQNLLESVRPELILTGWHRWIDGGRDVIGIAAVNNVGRGAALNVIINASPFTDPPNLAFNTKRLPVVAAGENNELDFQLSVWWKNVPPTKDSHKHVVVDLDILYWDARGFMRYETRYKLFISDLNLTVLSADRIAEGVMLTERRTAARFVWWLVFMSKLRRIPALGERIRKWLLQLWTILQTRTRKPPPNPSQF